MVKEEDMAETGCMELEGETIGKEAEMYVVMVVEGIEMEEEEGIEMEEEEGIEMILEISVGLDPEVTQEEDVSRCCITRFFHMSPQMCWDFCYDALADQNNSHTFEADCPACPALR